VPAVRSANEELVRRRAQSVPRGVGCVHPIAVARASGSSIWDVDGREYIDFVGGIGVLNAGHANPAIVAAIAAQAERYTHLCFQVTSYEPYVALAEALNARAPGPTPKKTLLLSTGAEGTENAVKIARAYTGRPAVIAFEHAYHGRTMLALTMTGKEAPYKQNFGPFCSEIYHSPYPNPLHGTDVESAMRSLQQLVRRITPERIAAVIIEPVLGEGGFVPAPAEFLRALRDVCTTHGIVMICDEVQTGFGRTGRTFAIEHAGIEPDVIVTAKSLAGGMPLCAVIGKADIMDAPLPGGLGGTYAGNPVACAAALATLQIMDEAFMTRATEVGARTRAAFAAVARRFPHAIADVRGIGAMIAMEFSGEQPPVARIVEAARERGLLLMPAGDGNVIRVLVPLTIDDATLDVALARFADSVESILAN
jgi:4-aminobutyrate aminotransferase/(S)-3-amino-2-methylpropionate transaminase